MTAYRVREKAIVAVLLVLFLMYMPENHACASEGSSTLPDAAPEESFFSKDYFKLLYEDTKFVLTAPARWEKQEWVTFSIATLGVAAVSLLDKPAWDLAKRNQTSTADNIATIVEKAGGGYSLAVPVAFYIAGEISENQKAKVVALDGLSASMIAGGIIHPTLKFLVGRSSPKDEEGTYRFSPFSFSLPQSFPSGHATQSFALASVISTHYPDLWVKITAYSIASLVSLARAYEGEHFVSDWAAGALIGTVVGNTVVWFNEKLRKEKKEQSVFIMPFFGRGAVGLNLAVRID